MSYTLTGKLVVAISSRALFDFEEENRIFESSDDSAYMKLQLERLGKAAQTGVAFPLVKKLLAFSITAIMVLTTAVSSLAYKCHKMRKRNFKVS